MLRLAAMLAPPPLPRTLEAALRDLTSARPATRASAIGDLVSHALLHDGIRARAVPLLEAALKGDDAPEARAAAAVGLGDLHAVEALSALLVAIEDADVQVRQLALNALGEVGDARALPRLERALADARPEVRYQAIIAYTKVAHDPGDVDAALARACKDADDAVRYIALRIAEERLDPPRAPPWPTSEAVLREARVRLKDDAPHVQLAAAILVSKAAEGTTSFGSHEGEALAAARVVILGIVRGGKLGRLGAPGPDKEDEREAVEIAGALGLREAIPDLERRAWGLGSLVRDTCAWHAKIALARMGHPKASAEILKDLEAGGAEKRAAAVVAAGKARLKEAAPRLRAIAKLGAEGLDPQLVTDALARLES
jgi:HEAT repeat protein